MILSGVICLPAKKKDLRCNLSSFFKWLKDEELEKLRDDCRELRNRAIIDDESLRNKILEIGTVPFQLLLGTVSHNWACVLEVGKGYITSMDTSDFMKL